MGLFDWISNLLGINLETRLRKAMFMFMFFIVGIVVLSIIDPLLDGIIRTILTALFPGTSTFGIAPDMGLPLTIPEITAYMMSIWPPFGLFLGYARDSTFFALFFSLGIGAMVLAILLGYDPDNPTGGSQVAKVFGRLATFFNKQREKFR